MFTHFSNRNGLPAQDAAAGAVVQRPDAVTLSITALERLAPCGHLKAGYPHVWERIWLFCNDPAHLDKYLMSLSLQERDGKRAGLSPQAMGEVADILAANQRFLAAPAADTLWDAASLKR
jgi:hypothetical protein